MTPGPLEGGVAEATHAAARRLLALLQGLLATLSQEGAATLNQLLGQDVFTTGQPVGRTSARAVSINSAAPA